MTAKIGIVDLFSGPGGLGEGFASLKDSSGNPVFEIDLSIEAEPTAHRTLRLRSFLRKVPGGFPQEYFDWINGLRGEPNWSVLWPAEWSAAEDECRHMELGAAETTAFLSARLPEIRATRGDSVILIGGPPCQAYSLAGRSRAGAKGFVPHPKKRHLLYREYISVLRDLQPACFVMENVKGMLSSHTPDAKILDLVLADLRSGGATTPYKVFPIAAPEGADLLKPLPTDFVVHAERHGVPQARHRVIIVGIRADIAERIDQEGLPRLQKRDEIIDVQAAIGDLPALRSLLSARAGIPDSPEAWADAVRSASKRIRHYAGRGLSGPERTKFIDALREAESSASLPPPSRGVGLGAPAPSASGDLMAWLRDPRVALPTHHEPRSHMTSDLERYLFAAAWSAATGSTPKAQDFPKFLAPDHDSWGKGFADRFRVQSSNRPATTITCHLSKDGHYFIHPDPTQVRSLTVREAARIQTFPDNYHFMGSRTQAYVQVGNAVPPFLAHQIATAIAGSLVPALSRPALSVAAE